MPIVIRELFSSDPLSEVLEKINFNFDQIVLSGGGPPGPQGTQGVPGIPGPQGERGDHWQVGSIAPTADHGPNFGSLKDFDLWLSSGGTVSYWDSVGATWNATGVNLTGPQGPPGLAGGSFEFKYYQGITGGIQTAFQTPFSNYLPNAIVGGTTSASGNADFITIRNYDNVSLFLGDGDWAYNSLTNFSLLDFNGPAPSPPNSVSQRVLPKLTLIQTGINTSGNGGFSFGAYGATNAKGTDINDYLGSPSSVTDARNFFNAGFAIDTVGPTYSHYFKAGTRSIDLEFYAGDIFNTNLGLTGATTGFYYPEIRLLTTEFGRTIIKDTAGNNRLILEQNRNRFEKPLVINTIWPTLDAGSYFDNVGVGRNRGSFYVGDLTGNSSIIGIGYARTSSGISNLGFFTEGSTPTSETFSIFRGSGANGVGRILQTGSGFFEFNHIGTGDIRFLTTGASTERMRITNSGRVGIGVFTPNELLEVAGNIHVSGGDRTIFNRSNNYLAFGTNNTEVSRITATGLFGIGTSTPSSKLHIVGTGPTILTVQGNAGSYIDLINTGTTVRGKIGFSSAVSTDLEISNTQTAGSISLNTSINGLISINAGSNIEMFNNGYDSLALSSNGYATFGVNSGPPLTSRIFIDGTNFSQSAGLDYPLLIRTSGNYGSSRNGILFQKNKGSGLILNDVLGSIGFGGSWDSSNVSVPFNNGGAYIQAIADGNWTNTARPTDLTFWTSSDLGTLSRRRLTVKSNGTILIGSPGGSTPILGNELEFVNDNNAVISLTKAGTFGYNLTIRAGEATGTDQDGGNLILAPGISTGTGNGLIAFLGYGPGPGSGPVVNTYSEKARMTDAGDWGFGTVTPSKKLDVFGGIRISNNPGIPGEFAMSNGLFLSADQTTRNASIRPYKTSTNGRVGMSFFTDENGTVNENMRMFPSGRILLGNIGSPITSASGRSSAAIDTLDDFFRSHSTQLTYTAGKDLIESGSFTQLGFNLGGGITADVYQIWQRIGRVVTVTFQVDATASFNVNTKSFIKPIAGLGAIGVATGQDGSPSFTTKTGRVRGGNNDTDATTWTMVNHNGGALSVNRLTGTYVYTL